MLQYLQALQALLIILLVGAFAYLVYKAVKHPAEFAQDTGRAVGKTIVTFNEKIEELTDHGFDETLGRIPVVGKTVSNVAKAAVFLPAMPVRKPIEILSKLASGQDAWGAVTSTPGEAWGYIRNIF